MSQSDMKAEAKPEFSSEFRPMGLSFSFIVYGIAGIFYLLYPLLQDPSLFPLYVMGGFSLLGSFGVMRMTRWGLWLGLLLYPVQVVAPTFALISVIQGPFSLTSPIVIAFIAGLAALMFLTTLSFLFILDKRKSFK